MIIRLNGGEWFQVQADVVNYAPGPAIRITDARGREVALLQLARCEAPQLEQRMAEARREAEEP